MTRRGSVPLLGHWFRKGRHLDRGTRTPPNVYARSTQATPCKARERSETIQVPAKTPAYATKTQSPPLMAPATRPFPRKRVVHGALPGAPAEERATVPKGAHFGALPRLRATDEGQACMGASRAPPAIRPANEKGGGQQAAPFRAPAASAARQHQTQPRASSTGTYSDPTPSATLECVTFPAATLIPGLSPGSRETAAWRPLSASESA